MARRIRIRDIEGGAFARRGWRRPLRTAIAVIVATAMLTPTIASAAPVVPDAPTPVPDAAAYDDAGHDADDVDPSPDGISTDSPDMQHDHETGNDATPSSSSSDSTAEEDAERIDGAQVLSDGEDGSGKVLLADADAIDGRDYSGQVTKTIGSTTYILIGNEQQLRAIGSDKPVIGGPVYRIAQEHHVGGWENEKGAVPELLYPGDADLDANTGMRGEGINDDNGHGADITEVFNDYYKYFTIGGDDAWNYDVKGNTAVNTGLTYSADANYIIFRDIDLSQKVADEPSDGLWTPLMFSGTMIGAKTTGDGTLWDDAASSITAAGRPTISDVTVNQSEDELDPTEYAGIGFFGTLTGKLDENDPFNGSTSQVVVSNISLNHVSITNKSTSVRVDHTLVSGLLGTLGAVAGGLVSGLLKILTFGRVDLSGLIEGLLTVRARDPSTLATGAFVGRVIGDVRIEDSTVADVSVDSAAPMVGGFAGYVEGETRYATEGLGNVVQLLSHLLNLIPGLGLGDLVTLLLDKDIDVGSLIPSSYDMPVIGRCEVRGFAGNETTLGRNDISYVGGFVGSQSGAIIRDSMVYDDALSVKAKEYAGGFAGVMHDGQIKGLLENLGVDLGLDKLAGLRPQSLVLNSSVEVQALTVSVTNRAGGFTGAMAASYAVDSSVSAGTTLTVSAADSHAGGFAGQMTMGWATNLGIDDGDNDLVGGLSSIITGILNSGDDRGQLLTLAGFEPSAALGCGVSGGSVTVNADGPYAGGFTGDGEGAVIARSDADHVDALTHWQAGGTLADTTVTPLDASIKGLSSVKAKAYAGGVAGRMETAAVGGLLNNTLGIGDLKDLAGQGFNAFEVSDVTANGVEAGFTVTVDDYDAGGAIGLATGGEMRNVGIGNLGGVTGAGEVGGFIGQAAAGGTLDADGIDLLGLVKLSGLLTVAQTTHLNVDGSNVTGIADGFTVAANGKNDAAHTDRFTAGGFYGRASSMTTTDGHVTNLRSITAPDSNGIAGGFVGLSTTGGLAQIASDEDESSNVLEELTKNGLLNINDLLGAVPYMVPKYKVTDVAYVDGGGVTADIAGGYAGSFESGEVNKFDEGEDGLAAKAEASPWAVKNVSTVAGRRYAGGFGGRVVSGSLAEAGGGLDLLGGGILNVNIAQLLTLISAYMPVISRAGVSADADPVAANASTTDGFTVSATKGRKGVAGGFIGYGSGIQVSASDVKYLKHTDVTEPDNLEGPDGDSYFGSGSSYAVTATLRAGGYIGEMNIGSTASAGESLSLLGGSIQLNDVLDVLDAVASDIEDSDVEGQAGGYAVLASDASDATDPLGDAGGFAGVIRGSRIENSDAHNFSHIIGQVSAGGYMGQAMPGDVADILGDDTSILNGLVNADGSLASLLQHFVPEILNSETTSIPCGGAVRAQAFSDASTLRGLAGGYVGHNVGAQIWGNHADDGETPKEAAVIRIRSVYGAEYAGGFTGLMEAGSTASTGSLGLLWGLVNANNLLSALNVAYPTEENTAVYGPLHGLTVDEWNAWVLAVGKHGGYGAELAENGTVETEDELAQKLADDAYGMNVVAGRKTVAGAGGANVKPGGAAGGYAGAMIAGTVTNGHAHDVRLVRGMRAAGGFAGSAETGGAAQLGSVGILGLDLGLDNLLGVAQVFVPVVKSSSVEGYRTGMTVASPGLGSHGDDTTNGTGNAGGYIGLGSGVQIWGVGTDGGSDPCGVSGLRRVRGSAYAGGYAGRLTAGAVADVDTGNVSSGFLQKVVDAVLDGTGTSDLAQVLQATMSTVRGASVSPADEAWGFTVEGPASGDVEHPIAAGGFAGAIEATVLGDRDQGTDDASVLTVSGLRGVDGGLYAGGFVGVATAGGAASVDTGTGEGTSTTILAGLLKLGDINAIQAFQPFIYGGSVTGVADGLQIRANEWDTGGLMHSQRASGNAGGFAGTVMSGEILDSKVESLNSVAGVNYTGGFIGYAGKSGIVSADSIEALKLVGLTASVGDLIGTTVERCSVAGIPAGYTVASQGPAGADSVNGDEPGKAEGGQKAGGFIGYADLAHITGGTATDLKRVGSVEAAGGFAGETSHAYLVSAEADSVVLGALNQVVNALVKALYLDKAEQAGVIKVNLGSQLELHILSEGDALSVTLLGLKISASLSKGTGEGGTDVVNVTIGDSEITLPCDENGLTEDADLEVNLIKGNSAHITDSKVTGIADGYDVFGGGAAQDKNGEDGNGYGYAGGFVGHNDEGVLTGDEMIYADVVRGTAGKTGPFTGVTDYNSNWWFNGVDDIEHDNTYHVYRGVDLVGAAITSARNMTVASGVRDEAGWARFDVSGHQPKANGSNLADWEDAKANDASLGVYREGGAKAVLMDDAAVSDNTGGLTPEPGDGQDPCAQKVDVTVQKVWNDGHDVLHRPTEITVKLKATYTDGSGNTHTPDPIQSVDADGNPLGERISNPITVTLSTDDQSSWSDTWRKVVEDLPVAIKVGSAVHYLTYTPTEVTVGKGEGAVKLGESGYTVSYTVDAHDRVITITNSTPLPETGGMGAHWFAILGILLVGVGILLTRKDTYGRGTGRHRAAR